MQFGIPMSEVMRKYGDHKEFPVPLEGDIPEVNAFLNLSEHEYIEPYQLKNMRRQMYRRGPEASVRLSRDLSGGHDDLLNRCAQIALDEGHDHHSYLLLSHVDHIRQSTLKKIWDLRAVRSMGSLLSQPRNFHRLMLLAIRLQYDELFIYLLERAPFYTVAILSQYDPVWDEKRYSHMLYEEQNISATDLFYIGMNRGDPETILASLPDLVDVDRTLADYILTKADREILPESLQILAADGYQPNTMVAQLLSREQLVIFIPWSNKWNRIFSNKNIF